MPCVGGREGGGCDLSWARGFGEAIEEWEGQRGWEVVPLEM